MFRQEEAFVGDWQEKTIDAMQRRRFEQLVSQLPPLGSERIENLSNGALERKLEQCWQDIPRKPMRKQQETQIWKTVLGGIKRQADCLSHEEHELVERALILGGCAQIEDTQELEAARALSLRLWANVGLISGKPYVELEQPIIRPVARAFAREEHENIRRRFEAFHSFMTATLYRVGAMDDRQPQQMILREVLRGKERDEQARQLARRYLWASYDCVDYNEGVLLIHAALADPKHMLSDGRRKTGIRMTYGSALHAMDILPEEIPLQQGLERAIDGALRNGIRGQDVARTIRFLCKQGAPLSAMEDVLQSSLIVYLSGAMRSALSDMYYMTPKWIECSEYASLQ